jgi:hypothetical protein
MTYKPGVPIQLNDFTRVCGYFAGIAAADGYGCWHPENTDRIEDELPDGTHVSIGHCLACNCPLADELLGTDPADAAILAAHGLSADAEEWMVPWRARREGEG